MTNVDVTKLTKKELIELIDLLDTEEGVPKKPQIGGISRTSTARERVKTIKEGKK